MQNSVLKMSKTAQGFQKKFACGAKKFKTMNLQQKSSLVKYSRLRRALSFNLVILLL
jgi:hypothetical protein